MKYLDRTKHARVLASRESREDLVVWEEDVSLVEFHFAVLRDRNVSFTRSSRFVQLI